MTNPLPVRGTIVIFFRGCLLLLPLLSLACGGGDDPSTADADTPIRRIDTARRGPRTTGRDLRAAPLLVAARISKVKIQWGDTQQVFTLTLTNGGDKSETVHAIVYATNEQTNPPRRAVSPPTAYQWFELAKSKDGRLTAGDIQKNWRTNAFVTARGGKLPFSWQVTLKPAESQSVEAAHNLDERSPHPTTKGKKLAHVGFLEYQIWLFTPDGQCFDEQTVAATSASSKKRPSVSPATKKAPATNKESSSPTATKSEQEAARALRLAKYYLDNNKPALARAKLQLILDKYPQSAAAAEAKKLLATVPE